MAPCQLINLIIKLSLLQKMKFSVTSLIVFASVALAADSPRRRKRALKEGKKGKQSHGGHESIRHHNADYQDHYLVSINHCL